MPPSKVSEDIAEMKSSLQFLCKSFDEIKVSNKQLKDALLEMKKSNDTMNKRIDLLESKLQSKDEHIDRLVGSMDLLEMNSKKNNVIISGLDLQARSYARATSGNDHGEENGTGNQSGGEFTGLRQKVAEFVKKSMGVQLQTSDIVACHELPSRKGERVKPVIVSLINNAVKRDVMMGRKKLKGTRIYVNEQLTKKNAALFKKARDLKKQATIDSTWTYNGKVFLKKSQSGSPIEITAEEDLSPFVA